MKKLLGIMVLGLLLASCTDRYDDYESSSSYWWGVIGSILFILSPFLYAVLYENPKRLEEENVKLKYENEELKKKSKKRKKRKS